MRANLGESAKGQSMDEQKADSPDTPRSGWWWKFVALFLGVPPVAVWGAEEEVEEERAAR
jgi:hypothetical protein